MTLKVAFVSLVLLSLIPVHGKINIKEFMSIAGNNISYAYLTPKLDIILLIPASRSKSRVTEAVVRIKKMDLKKWKDYFRRNYIKFDTGVKHIPEIRAEEEPKPSTKDSLEQYWDRWDSYYSHNEINLYLNMILKNNSKTVTLFNGAWSADGRQIQYLLYSNSKPGPSKKPLIIITGLVDAREWATSVAAMYVLRQVVKKADKKISEAADWLVIPVVNPDGYEYSRHEDRYWSKTRSTNKMSDCLGVNLNYNFDVGFGGFSQNNDSCSSTYEGPAPFSEPEGRVIADVIRTHKSRVSLYINLRSQGNLVLYPWAHNGSVPGNILSLHKTGVAIATAMDRVAEADSSSYIVGCAGEVLSNVTGSPIDFAMANGVHHAYDLSLHGFIVPQESIKQFVTEAWAGIAAAANKVLFENS